MKAYIRTIEYRIRIVFTCCSASLSADLSPCAISLAPINACFGAVSVHNSFVVNDHAAVLEDIVSHCLWHMTRQYLHIIWTRNEGKRMQICCSCHLDYNGDYGRRFWKIMQRQKASYEQPESSWRTTHGQLLHLRKQTAATRCLCWHNLLSPWWGAKQQILQCTVIAIHGQHRSNTEV